MAIKNNPQEYYKINSTLRNKYNGQLLKMF